MAAFVLASMEEVSWGVLCYLFAVSLVDRQETRESTNFRVPRGPLLAIGCQVFFGDPACMSKFANFDK